MGSDFGEEVITQIAAHASLHYFGSYFSENWFDKDLAKMLLPAVQGKNDGEDDDDSEYVVDGGPDVNED